MRMPKLIPNARDLPRFYSTHVMAAGFVFSVIKAGLLAAAAGSGFFTMMAATWAWVLVALLFVLGVAVRVLHQEPPKPPTNAGKSTQ